MMVGQRKGLLNYLKKQDIERYRTLIAELGIRKIVRAAKPLYYFNLYF